jgi:hypothetical protein
LDSSASLSLLVHVVPSSLRQSMRIASETSQDKILRAATQSPTLALGGLKLAGHAQAGVVEVVPPVASSWDIFPPHATNRTASARSCGRRQIEMRRLHTRVTCKRS